MAEFDICKIRALIFDLDGTLIDTMKYFGDVASKVINKYYGVPLYEAKKMYFNTSGVPFIQQLEILFPNDKRNSVAAKEYEKNKLSFFFSEKFSPELKDIIIYEKKKYPNVVFVVSSNNYEELVKKYFEDNNLYNVFDEILGYRDGFSKGKDHFSYLKKKYGINNENMVFIGDSWWDAKIAVENGVNFVAIDRTFSVKEWKKKYPNVRVLKWFDDLAKFIEEVGECKQ